MLTKIERPIEVPTHEELLNRPIKHENFEIKKFNNELLEKIAKILDKNFEIEFVEKKPEFFPKVSLSWEKDIETVIDWMENHMEAFKETHNWFLVDFIGDDWNKWYKVIPHDQFEIENIEAQIEIDWVLYDIFEYTFSKSEQKMYEMLDKLEKKSEIKDITKKEHEKICRELMDILLKNDEDEYYKNH